MFLWKINSFTIPAGILNWIYFFSYWRSSSVPFWPWNNEGSLRNLIFSEICDHCILTGELLCRKSYRLYCRIGLLTWSYGVRWLQSHLMADIVVFYCTENDNNLQQRNTPILLIADVAMLTHSLRVCFLNILITFCQYFILKVKMLLKWVPVFIACCSEKSLIRWFVLKDFHSPFLA